jgi:hypothetical protein
MRILVIVLVALSFAVSATPAAFAAPKTKAACEKANMEWDEATKTCRKPDSGSSY